MTRATTHNQASAQTNAQASVIGAGPAGLMAAEQLCQAGYEVDVYEAMPSVGRKFLRAGIGGLNLTHAEDKSDFINRFGAQRDTVATWLDQFDAAALREWAAELGIDTFVGSSGRVFPTAMKAAPLLRAWLRRLRQQGCRIHTRHYWRGWNAEGLLEFDTPEGKLHCCSQVTVFALGGGSWRKLGSDGHWQQPFQQRHIECLPFRPSNCGFEADWRQDFQAEFQGQPLKSAGLQVKDQHGQQWSQRGDATISRYGIEGGLVYALSAPIRDRIDLSGQCEVYWDLLPDRSPQQIQAAISKKRPKDSLSSFLKRGLKLDRNKQAFFNQLTSKEQARDLKQLPQLLKHLPQTLTRYRPLDEAISTAGGVNWTQFDASLMLKQQPGLFCAGEMLDWEAPTGGYLLTACFASGRVAGQAAAQWLAKQASH